MRMNENTSFSRRKFMTAAATTAVGAGALAGNASAFNKYSSVFTTTNLSVRTGAGTGYSRKAVADQYTGGYVLDGPVNNNGYTWWKVRYNGDSDNGAVTGWSAEGDGWLAHAEFSYPSSGTLTSTYYDSRSSGNHGAVDIANDTGTVVRATRGGTVSTVGWDGDGYGNYVIVSHSGSMSTLYAHLNDVHVWEGKSVYWDEHIGDMGSTGNSTGPHVHYEIRDSGVRQYVPPSDSLEGNYYYARSGVPKYYY